MKWQFWVVMALLLVAVSLGCMGKKETTEQEISNEATEEIPEFNQETDTSDIDTPDFTEDDIDLGEII